MNTGLERDIGDQEWRVFRDEVCSGEAFRLFCETFQTAIKDQKTRSVRLIGRRCDPQVATTLLGYEIIAAGKRILCPDRTTADYLSIFAAIGMREVPIPYDVTRTRDVLPDLQRAYTNLTVILDFFSDQLLSRRDKTRFLQGVYSALRHSLSELCPTDSLPSPTPGATG